MNRSIVSKASLELLDEVDDLRVWVGDWSLDVSI